MRSIAAGASFSSWAGVAEPMKPDEGAGRTAEQMLIATDLAMYEAKRGGRDRYVRAGARPHTGSGAQDLPLSAP